MKHHGTKKETSSGISILITGASGGIGYATAIACAKRGARIGIHYHENRKRAEHLAGELDGAGHCLLQADITDPDAAQNLGVQADNELGGLDVLVNNAGIAQRRQMDAISYQTWQATWKRVIDTNLTGPANLSFCVAGLMLERGGGRMVNVSSRGAFRGEPRMPWYGASKAGMNAMGQSMAQALAPRDIFVFTVAPGFVETEMAREILASAEGESLRNQSSMGRVARPEEVARTIEFLAFDAPAFMTGCIIDVNGASYLRS
ncbi:MAG: SDR family NAD(P)-dependent oxidoreductase [Gammaproteobacteria bacterium]|nr:SDR family NAD(P)-dependent oxidoreductase [Gammaproteobacteria bacterium]